MAIVEAAPPDWSAVGATAASGRLDSAGASAVEWEKMEQIHRLATELDEEERDLWKQLRRKRDFEDRVAEKRAQLAELCERRKGASTAHAEVSASVERLTNEVRITKGIEREVANDVLVLKESNRIMQGAFQESAKSAGATVGVSVGTPAVASTACISGKDAAGSTEESAQVLHEQVEHFRGHLDRCFAEKKTLQDRQQALFDKQRSAEQDRNRLLSALQDDRKRINELRSERIALWEERCSMEREITKLVQEAAFQSLAPGGPDHAATKSRWATPPRANQACGVDPFSPDVAADDQSSISFGKEDPMITSSGGIRVPAVRDTPNSLPGGPAVVGGGVRSSSSVGAVLGSSSRAPSVGKEKSRPHWTSFDNAAGGAAQRSTGTGGITEWAGRVKDFHASQN